MVRVYKSNSIKKRLVVQALKGQTDNIWANAEALYGWFAYFFNWTPEQVDKIPYDRLIYLITIHNEMKRQENQNGKRI